MKQSLEEILLVNGLNLDLPNDIISYEDQTNKTITKIMNNFIKNNGKYFSNKTFYITSNNDLPTLITYSILKGINAIYEFSFKVIGDISRIKKYLKFENEIDNHSIGDILRLEDTIIVSPFNPIYYVKKDFEIYKNSIQGIDTINLIESLAPKQLEIIADFYGIDMSKFKKNSQEIGQLHRGLTFESHNLSENKHITNKPKIKIVELEGDETDFELFDKIINTDDCCFYFIKEEFVETLKANLNPFIKSKNAARDKNDLFYCNINNYDIMKELDNYEHEFLFIPREGD